jgi:transcriptional regulator with XRE-family HTH domain
MDIPVAWTPDYSGPWTQEDQAWLEICLHLAAHFDDGHDPVDCQRAAVAGRSEWRLLRAEEGLTLARLGQLLDVDGASISRWETGDRWPNAAAYLSWLRQAGERLGEKARMALYLTWLKRDGWIGQGGETAGDLWSVLFKPRGLFDRYLDTGTLPRWPPSQASWA